MKVISFTTLHTSQKRTFLCHTNIFEKNQSLKYAIVQPLYLAPSNQFLRCDYVPSVHLSVTQSNKNKTALQELFLWQFFMTRLLLFFGSFEKKSRQSSNIRKPQIALLFFLYKHSINISDVIRVVQNSDDAQGNCLIGCPPIKLQY